MPEYTAASIAAVLLIVVLEAVFWRSGIFTSRAYWIAMGIVVFFQILMDGWLTKLSAPIVIYGEKFFSGWRFPFDIPVEDFLFGFALVTLALSRWVRSSG